MKTIKYLLIITIILIISSCGNDCKDSYDYLIPENEKFRLQSNDTLIYLSNLNNFDTIFIEQRINYNTIIEEKDEFFSCTYEIRKEVIGFKMHLINKDTIINQTGLSQTFEEPDLKEINFTVEINDNLFKDCLIKTSFDMQIKDSLYKEVSEFQNDTNDIFKVYTNLDYGIIKYCYKNGEEFILYEYIP